MTLPSALHRPNVEPIWEGWFPGGGAVAGLSRKPHTDSSTLTVRTANTAHPAPPCALPTAQCTHGLQSAACIGAVFIVQIARRAACGLRSVKHVVCSRKVRIECGQQLPFNGGASTACSLWEGSGAGGPGSPWAPAEWA